MPRYLNAIFLIFGFIALSAHSRIVRAEDSAQFNVKSFFEIEVKTGEILNSTDITMSQLAEKKKNLVLFFFASWCEYCRGESPKIETFRKAMQKCNLTVVGVNLDESKEDAQKAIKEWPVTSPVYFDRDAKLKKQFKIKKIPTLAFADAKGEILKVVSGTRQNESFLTFVKDKLKEEGCSL